MLDTNVIYVGSIINRQYVLNEAKLSTLIVCTLFFHRSFLTSAASQQNIIMMIKQFNESTDQLNLNCS
jgi:hypothetical protein